MKEFKYLGVRCKQYMDIVGKREFQHSPYGHELLVERIRLWIEAAELSFLYRVAQL